MDAEAIQDIFQDLGAVRIRRMFGGHGIYRGDRIFALQIHGAIYIKVDDANRPAFEEAGSRPFTYDKDGQPVAMSYWLLPEDALEDPAEAARWARLGLEASGRAEASKAKKKRKP